MPDLIALLQRRSAPCSFGVATLLGALSATFTPICLAQSAPTATGDTAEMPVVEEIVVTARKRSERQQDVPLSVDVVGSEQLQQNDPQDFKDVLRDIPGVSFSGTEQGQSRYNIRGISTNSASPTVGIYLDDISLLSVSTAFSGAIDPVFFDMSRVEVLKGPQGTLYGGSAMGGAIKYVSNAPDLTAAAADLGSDVSFTEDGAPSYGAQGVYNEPLIDNQLGVRAGVLYRRDGGFVDNIADAPFVNFTQASTSPPEPFAPTTTPSLGTRSEKDQNGDHVLGLRLSALWRPDLTLDVTPSVFYQDSYQSNPGVFWTNLPGLQSSFRLPQPTDDRLWVGGLNIVKHFGSVDLTSLTGYVHRSLEQDRDYSFYVGSLVPALYALDSPNASDTFTRTVTQELRASSSDASAPLQFTAGLYFSDQKDRLDQLTQTTGVGDILGTGTDTVYFGTTQTRSKQYALFGNATYALLPKLDFGVGARAFRIEQTQSVSAGGLFNGGNSSTEGRSTQNGVSPKVELSSRITSDNLLYTSAAKGFRPGGPNGSFSSTLCGADLQRLGLSGVPSQYQSDNLWTYELGSKNQFLDRRLTVNAAGYYTDWKNIQQTILLPSCGFGYTGNVGAATVKGLELSGQEQLIGGLVAGGGVNYADAQITRTAPGVSAQVGQQVLDSPRWSGNAFLAYGFPLGATEAQMRADYQYHGSQLRDFASTFTSVAANGMPELVDNFNQRVAAYSLVNLNFSLRHRNWESSLFANNLLNTHPVIDFNPTNTFTQAFTVRPRTIGLSVRTHL